MNEHIIDLFYAAAGSRTGRQFWAPFASGSTGYPLVAVQPGTGFPGFPAVAEQSGTGFPVYPASTQGLRSSPFVQAICRTANGQ